MNWNLETLRSAAEKCYWRDYRYAGDRKGTLLSFVNDVMYDDDIYEGPFAKDHIQGSEWLRRFMSGVWTRNSGAYGYTVPGRERLNALSCHLQQDFLTPLTTLEHTGDYGAAFCASQHLLTYNCEEQAIFAGSLRGTFLATAIEVEKITCAVMLIHMVGSEELFRVRLVTSRTLRMPNETDESLVRRAQSGEIDNADLHDGFCMSGRARGTAFNFSPNDLAGGIGSDIGLTGYDWNVINSKTGPRTGRRIIAFSAGAVGMPGMRYSLCQTPSDIDHALTVLRYLEPSSISDQSG